MQLNGFEVHVNVDGAHIPEYSMKAEQDGKTISCWIPSEAGKCFTVTWRPVIGRPDEIAAVLKIDGISLGGYYLPANLTPTVVHSGARTSLTTERSYVFSSLVTTDDDVYLNNDNIKNIGDIAISFRKVRREAGEAVTRVCKLSDDKVHERSKKAMAHRVQLGETKQLAPQTAVKVKHLSVLAQFVFRYRSIDILRADGIAPPLPVARKTSGEKRKADEITRDDDEDGEEQESRDDEEADQAELKALLAAVNTINERVNAIQVKMTKKSGSTSKKKKVKTEPRSALASGEVIDLT
ncbi:hypothetical protein Hypma_014844 [Hypsizygus marmoreus]|uniref:DUF7918 domain-containing protein n=1 Tax=Hypsizygus marmoreus TaxID=39966 RepID=A0A369K233_HYPMA|nr:hypothetical protein Hypma_014844 [Hypsizygus marmoreus]